MKTLFRHAHLVIDGNREYEDGALLVDEDKILDVYYHSNKIDNNLNDYKEIDLDGKIVMPAFFDSHIHGGCGYDFNSINKQELDDFSNLLLKKGYASFLTTLTNNEKIIEQLNNLNDIKTSGANFLGIHLEGPFINKEYKGALNDKYIIKPNVDELNKLLNATNNIKQMTVAPELNGIDLIVDILKDNNIKIMLGHSSAFKKDVKITYDGFTHLFNGERGFHHRDLSLINLAFEDDKYIEIIGDGIHVDKSVLKFIFKNKDRHKIILISDALKIAGLNDDELVFENEKCHKENNVFIKDKDHKICGGNTFINDQIKIMYELGVSLTDILLMSSLNAYCLYGLDKHFGSLIKGKNSALVVLDDNLNLCFTYIKGRIINA